MVLIVSLILFIINLQFLSTFGVLTNSLYHDNLPYNGFNHFPAFNDFTSIDHEMMPMDSIWSPGYPQSHQLSNLFDNNFAHNPFLFEAHGMNSMYPSMLDAEPSMSTGSYSQSNRIGFGYGKGKGSSEIPEDIIDGIVAKVLVDEKLNPIFNPRRSNGMGYHNGYSGLSKSSYRKKNYGKKYEINDGRMNNNQYSNSNGNKSNRPLDSGLQDLSRYVKSLKAVAWDDERLENNGASSSSYREGKTGGISDYGPVFRTKYKKNDGSYNVYGFLVPMGKGYKNNNGNDGNNGNESNNVVRSAYARKVGQQKPCLSAAASAAASA